MPAKRILTALIGIPLIIYITYLGNLYFFSLVVLVSLAAQYEWSTITKNVTSNTYPFLSTCNILLILFAGYYGQAQDLFIMLIATLIVMLFMVVIKYPNLNLSALTLNYFGSLYIGLPLITIIKIRENTQIGFWGIIFLFVVIWATDTGAYFTGKLWGTKKLAPHISPKKTWVGFWGGIIFGLVSGLILSNIIVFLKPNVMVITLFASLAGQLGDLAESVFKRIACIKDSGKVLPGHGGVLDRIDSLLLAAPVVYIFLYWFIID